MANAFDAYQRARAGAMQQGQNMLAMEQAVEKIQRQRQMQDILGAAYQQPQSAQGAIPAMPMASAEGPLQPGAAPLPDYPEQAAVPAQPATPGKFNVSGAVEQLLAKGFIPEAMQMKAFQPTAQPGFTLGEGQVRYDAQGNVIAEGRAKKPKKGAAGSDLDVETKLRKEFTGQTKDFVKVRDAYRRIEASAKDPSAAGDMALIFNYMKVLDPGSTVREGEFATAQNATGVGKQVINTYNRILSGERLNPDQRMDFTNRAKGLYGAQVGGLKQLEQQYSTIAQNYGVDPKNVIVDYRVQNGGDLTPQDKEALKWANANPNDPRSAQIKQRLGAQ